jgi:hypothetical protein
MRPLFLPSPHAAHLAACQCGNWCHALFLFAMPTDQPTSTGLSSVFMHELSCKPFMPPATPYTACSQPFLSWGSQPACPPIWFHDCASSLLAIVRVLCHPRRVFFSAATHAPLFLVSCHHKQSATVWCSLVLLIPDSANIILSSPTLSRPRSLSVFLRHFLRK